MIRHTPGTVTTAGYEICGYCRHYLSADNPGGLGGVSQRRLAAQFGVSQQTVWFIVNGKHWKHAP